MQISYNPDDCAQSVERRDGSQDIKESSHGGLGYEFVDLKSHVRTLACNE